MRVRKVDVINESGGSPLNQRDLAQRQLAELRLRKHGFVEPSSPGRI